ncbi:FORKED 1 protein [Tanacetum coccineum]
MLIVEHIIKTSSSYIILQSNGLWANWLSLSHLQSMESWIRQTTPLQLDSYFRALRQVTFINESYTGIPTAQYLPATNTLQPLFANARGGYGAGDSSTLAGKTVERWLKERGEKKKEETRAHNAQLHAAFFVAGIPAAVATIAADTAAASASRKDK